LLFEKGIVTPANNRRLMNSLPEEEMLESAHHNNPDVSVIHDQALQNLIAADPGSHEQSRVIAHIMDVLPQHMFVLESDATLSFVNRAAREYLGSVEAISGVEGLDKIIHPEDLDSSRNAYRDASAHRIPVQAEARVRSKDGSYRWFLHQLFPLCNEHGLITRWFGMRTDIEDLKQSGSQAERENLALREQVDVIAMFEEIVGTSPLLRAVLARVAKVAATDSTVLITGETGTGKELIARAIHKRSNRCNGPFVSINCAAIPRDLIASELFGHEKGAFTGALQRRLGRFELAAGGTLFLDEIGELPAETQVALLRVLQEREFQRVGGNQTIRTDVRVIVATHRDLPAAIAAGTFRSDLFFRINVFPIEVPALRERKEDIQLLAEYFIERYASKAGKTIKRIDRKSLERLQSYSWPGNIRELQNVIERSVILCETENFFLDQSWVKNEGRAVRPLSHEMVSQEKELIEAALSECKGKVFGPSGAAVKLGLPPSTLDSKIRALQIDKRRFYSN